MAQLTVQVTHEIGRYRSVIRVGREAFYGFGATAVSALEDALMRIKNEKRLRRRGRISNRVKAARSLQ